MATAKKENPYHFTTGVGRASYVNVFYPNDKGKYNITFLFPKSDADTVKKIQTAREAARITLGPKKWGSAIPKPAFVVYDGDGVRPSDGMPFGDECKGMFVFTASCAAFDKKGNALPPPFVLKKLNGEIIKIIDTTEFYSGCYCRVSCNVFAYNVEGKKGLGLGLNSMFFVRDGERLDNRVDPETDWANAEDSEIESDFSNNTESDFLG